MQTIVKPKKKINPYFAGQVALVSAGYLSLLGLTALFILLSVASTGSAAFWWGVVAVLSSVASIIATCILGVAAYGTLEKKRRSWQPYRE